MNLKPVSGSDAPSGTILFVDDEPLSLKYFKASVGRYAKVLTASSPDAAMKILAEEGSDISVVVSDERMPHESGVSFLSDVRKSWPSTVRVLTSAYANIDNLQQAINGAGIHRFVPKPWDLDELCEAMQEALIAERESASECPPALKAGSAESANLELLALLVRELTQPLESLSTTASELLMQTGARSVTPTQSIISPMTSWSTQLWLGQITASAAQVQRDVEYCRSLANSIAELAEQLCGPANSQRASMAETVAEAAEHLALRPSDRRFVTIDAQQDFHYRAPQRIVQFVLVTLLRNAMRRNAGGRSDTSVELIRGADCNEVRISTLLTSDSAPCLGLEFERAIRCALSAFGGELSHWDSAESGVAVISVRLPVAETTGDVPQNH